MYIKAEGYDFQLPTTDNFYYMSYSGALFIHLYPMLGECIDFVYVAIGSGTTLVFNILNTLERSLNNKICSATAFFVCIDHFS